MKQKDYIEMGLNGAVPLKVILRGSIEHITNLMEFPFRYML